MLDLAVAVAVALGGDCLAEIRAGWSGTLVVNPTFIPPTTPENLKGLLATGRADVVAVGRAFIAGPTRCSGCSSTRRSTTRTEQPLRRHRRRKN